MSAMAGTASHAGLISCLACHFVSSAVPGVTHVHCPRCGAAVRHRKAFSLTRTWAYLIAAYALYIPANVLPIMDSRSLFLSQEDTIMSGVKFLWNTGSPVTASLIFFASVVEPLLKLFGLTALALKVRHHSGRIAPPTATRMFRLIHVVGRWSMLDIFVAAVLVALVQSPTLAQIAIGPAALAFGAVVIFTMLAALSFDPRFLWDEPRHE